jgi:hypothetical protein
MRLETRKERVTEKNARVDGEEKEGRGGEWGAGEARRWQGRGGACWSRVWVLGFRIQGSGGK